MPINWGMDTASVVSVAILFVYIVLKTIFRKSAKRKDSSDGNRHDVWVRGCSRRLRKVTTRDTDTWTVCDTDDNIGHYRPALQNQVITKE